MRPTRFKKWRQPSDVNVFIFCYNMQKHPPMTKFKSSAMLTTTALGVNLKRIVTDLKLYVWRMEVDNCKASHGRYSWAGGVNLLLVGAACAAFYNAIELAANACWNFKDSSGDYGNHNDDRGELHVWDWVRLGFSNWTWGVCEWSKL